MDTTVGSLCTGILGVDLAVEAHYGARIAWHSEVEPSVAPVIARHTDAPNLGDLTTIDWRNVEPVDILTAGYPCQPFSHAGNRKGAFDDRHLWPYIADAVRVLRPRRVVLENVAGHLSLGFDVVLGDLADAGFDAEWCVLRASDVGAPHQRARLFVVSANTDSVVGSTPESEHWRPRTMDEPGAQPGAERLYRPPAPADACRERLSWGTEHDRQPQARRLAERARRDDSDGLGLAPIAWGQYAPAIRRWEHTLGRPAPAPLDDAGRLSPPFVEWMMGYPAGWVDGLNRTQALKALGNAVVPQQATAALTVLDPCGAVASYP